MNLYNDYLPAMLWLEGDTRARLLGDSLICKTTHQSASDQQTQSDELFLPTRVKSYTKDGDAAYPAGSLTYGNYPYAAQRIPRTTDHVTALPSGLIAGFDLSCASWISLDGRKSVDLTPQFLEVGPQTPMESVSKSDISVSFNRGVNLASFGPSSDDLPRQAALWASDFSPPQIPPLRAISPFKLLPDFQALPAEPKSLNETPQPPRRTALWENDYFPPQIPPLRAVSLFKLLPGFQASPAGFKSRDETPQPLRRTAYPLKENQNIPASGAELPFSLDGTNDVPPLNLRGRSLSIEIDLVAFAQTTSRKDSYKRIRRIKGYDDLRGVCLACSILPLLQIPPLEVFT